MNRFRLPPSITPSPSLAWKMELDKRDKRKEDEELEAATYKAVKKAKSGESAPWSSSNDEEKEDLRGGQDAM